MCAPYFVNLNNSTFQSIMLLFFVHLRSQQKEQELSPVHTSNMSKQHVERCFDMSNVAVWHVESFWQHLERFKGLTSWGSAGSHYCWCGKSSGGLYSHSLGGPSAVSRVHQNEDDCKSTAAPNTTAPGAAFYVSFFAIVAMTAADKLSLSSSFASKFWLTPLCASSRRMTCIMCRL